MYKRSACTYCIVLCAARLSAAMLWLTFSMHKTNVEANKTTWNCGLIYSFDKEKLYQLILQQEFIQNIASDQMFISGEMVLQITLAALQQKIIGCS